MVCKNVPILCSLFLNLQMQWVNVSTDKRCHSRRNNISPIMFFIVLFWEYLTSHFKSCVGIKMAVLQYLPNSRDVTVAVSTVLQLKQRWWRGKPARNSATNKRRQLWCIHCHRLVISVDRYLCWLQCLCICDIIRLVQQVFYSNLSVTIRLT